MKTIITVKENEVLINLGGITVGVDIHTVFESIESLERFYKTIIPAKRWEEMKGSGIHDLFEASKEYRPFLQRAMNCFDVKGNAQTTIILEENGMISMEGQGDSTSSGSINMKELMQVASDISDYKEKKDEERRAEREKREAEWEAEQAEREAEFKSELDEARRKNQEQIDKLRAKMQNRHDEIIGTDQSMDFMADNEIVFEERPNAFDLTFHIGKKASIIVTYFDISEKASEEGYQITDPFKPLPGHLVSEICDSYGLDAKLEWEHEHAVNNVTLDPPVNEEETE